jgi:hypothetical protein
MIRAIEADNEIEREDFEDWKKAQEIKQADSFKDDGKFTEFEEVSAN